MARSFIGLRLIPVHMRDYRPMPAMADVRRHILQRIVYQSGLRGTDVTLSGGHGVVVREQSTREITPEDKFYPKGVYTERGKISKLPFDLSVSFSDSMEVYAADKDGKFLDSPTFGRDLLLRGDFESYGLQGVNERTWEASNGSFKRVRVPRSGRFAMQYQMKDGATSANFGLKTFTRVLLQDDYSFGGWIKPQGRMKVSAFVQYRPSGMNRYIALASSKNHALGEVTLEADKWQNFKFELKAMKAKNKKALPMRVMLKFEPLDDNARKLLLDDLVLIGWEDPEYAADIETPTRRTHVTVR